MNNYIVPEYLRMHVKDTVSITPDAPAALHAFNRRHNYNYMYSNELCTLIVN